MYSVHIHLHSTAVALLNSTHQLTYKYVDMVYSPAKMLYMKYIHIRNKLIVNRYELNVLCSCQEYCNVIFQRINAVTYTVIVPAHFLEGMIPFCRDVFFSGDVGIFMQMKENVLVDISPYKDNIFHEVGFKRALKLTVI